mgnify:CR=1 FL=1
MQGRAGSSPDNDETGRHYQTVRVRQARSKGVTKVNQWLNPLKDGTGSKSGGYGPGSSARCPLRTRAATPKPVIDAGQEASGESLRRTRSEAAAAELGADPINRDMVNVGTVPGLPFPPPDQGGDGQAHRQLTAPERGGGSVVVRGRESRSHGEGTQRVRNEGPGMPGGRR